MRRDRHTPSWSGIPTTKRGFIRTQVRTAHRTPRNTHTRGTPQVRQSRLPKRKILPSLLRSPLLLCLTPNPRKTCLYENAVRKRKGGVLLCPPLLLRPTPTMTLCQNAVKATRAPNQERYEAVLEKRNSCCACRIFYTLFLMVYILSVLYL